MTSADVTSADVTSTRPSTAETQAAVLRIGEVAKLAGLTARTLRYWEELGLIIPASHRGGGERLYTRADVTRVERIRDLQKLLGFSLAEVRVVLETEELEALIRIKAEFRSGAPSPERRRDLLDEAIAANDQLLARLDETLSHLRAFRAERAASATRLRARRQAIDAEITSPAAAARGDAGTSANDRA